MDLKKWNAKVFGDVGKKKKELLESIKELECFEEARGASGGGAGSEVRHDQGAGKNTPVRGG